MHRKYFLKILTTFPIFGSIMKLNALDKFASSLSNSERMPLLFLGHGSPMNAIEENEFVAGFRKVGNEINRPKAILCISAHWETKGTYVTAMNHPRTIHDFGGFPKSLYEEKYPAPGSPELARETKRIITKTEVGLDDNWGLDHGAWTVIKHMYPQADIPIIQMSLDNTQKPEYHYQLAKELVSLREKGILIVGSGNMVHNLGRIAWDKMNVDNFGYDWAIEANEKMKSYLIDGNHHELINYQSLGKALNLSIPTPDHFLPMLYVLALKNDTERIELFNDKYVGGSISMTSFKIS